ncbi:hypothetical protein PQX77_021342, partial [Marasmius sp. AFHP31]
IASFTLVVSAVVYRAEEAKYKGEYEEPIKLVLDQVEKATEDGEPGVILFINELHLCTEQKAEQLRMSLERYNSSSGRIPVP